MLNASFTIHYSRALRILQISSARTLGGGERHLVDLIGGLARRGHEVSVALRPDSPLRGELASLPARNVLALPLRNSLDIGSAIALARFVRERRIEIIHAHMARDYPLAALAAGRAPDARLFVTRHVLFPLGRVHKFLLRDVSRVVAVSEAVARALRAGGIFPEHKICIIPNGIDIDRFEKVATEIDREAYRLGLGVRVPLVVGTIGELSEVKGQEDFIRAASIIARQTDAVEFLIVGEDASRSGETRARLVRLIDELGLGGRVQMLGRRTDVAEILTCMDVFVSASRSEAFGLALVEAMAAGVPVVATATEGAREVVEDGATGSIVPVGDADALALAVGQLLASAGQRSIFVENARRRARERWSVERMVKETEAIYLEAAGRARS